jgi:transcription termination factor NusB
MLYYDTPYTLTLVRRSKDSWSRKFDRIKNCPDCIFFREDLPIAMTFGKQLKSELAKCNIVMINHNIEINNKDQIETIINQIEYILEYLNSSIDKIDDNSDNIEKELEEKYKDEIDNLKTCHNAILLDKCFTTMKK